MAVSIDAIPQIIELNDFGGDWRKYIDAIYDVFYGDFIKHRCKFGSNQLRLKWHPLFQDKAYTFYHMTHKGDIESERIPDLRRCERMPWARPTVEDVEDHALKFWEQERNGRHRICVWLDVDNGDDYYCIIEVRKEYVLMWTAFYADYPNASRKKEREYIDWLAKQNGKHWTPDELVKDIQSRLP